MSSIFTCGDQKKLGSQWMMCILRINFFGNISALDASLFQRLIITQGVEYIRLREISRERRMVICSAASAAGSSNPDSDFNPYEVVKLVSILQLLKGLLESGRVMDSILLFLITFF